MSTAAPARERCLRALGVEPLRLRAVRVDENAGVPLAVAAAAPVHAVADADSGTRITRLALHPDPVELRDPAINKMYAALSEAIGKAGLQPVRVCDVADDPSAAVMVFGAALLPEGVPLARVLRAEPLAVLHADRECKRQLWERMQALGRDGAG